MGSCCYYQTEWAASWGVKTLIIRAKFPAMNYLDFCPQMYEGMLKAKLKYRGDCQVKELIRESQELWLKGNKAVSREQDMTNWHISSAGLHLLYNCTTLVLEMSTSRPLCLIGLQHKCNYSQVTNTNIFPSFLGIQLTEDGLTSTKRLNMSRPLNRLVERQIIQDSGVLDYLKTSLWGLGN